MLISVPGNTQNIWTFALQNYFCRAAKCDEYHIEIEKTDGEGRKGVRKVSTYWVKLQNRGRPSKDGWMLELAF